MLPVQLMLPTGLLLAAAAGLSDLAGSALVLTGRDGLRKWFDAVLAFGLGFVLAIALGELLPEAIGASPLNVLWLAAGFALLFLVDRRLKGSGLGLTLAGMVICDFFDGFAVASAAALAGASGAAGAAGGGAEEAATGWLLVGGLFPHNFLEGASIALLMLGAGMSRRVSWLVAVALALASLLGGAAVVLALPDEVRAPIQGLAAGFLLYVVLMERLPRLLAAPRRGVHVALVALGTASFFALGLIH